MLNMAGNPMIEGGSCSSSRAASILPKSNE